MGLKERIKQYAYQIGADLVGFGDIGRCRHAPVMMSPQGIYPDAKTVIVLGLHHPDACIELGGETHPQNIGPYTVQYLMNSRLDEMSYRTATFLEEEGYGSVPIVSSNIWRYNEYKDLKAVFAPDVSHIYMAVVTGLAEIGYSGLAISPEYGARNRFVTIITDAEVEPDPLIPPGTVCDGCMLCKKHCPAQALSKEIAGEKVLRIDPYEYRFPDKNLWRCSWGEHFDLDLDLELPDVVNEGVIKEYVSKCGTRSGEMGQCLKYCLPKDKRSFDRSYSSAPLRRNAVSLDEGLESRALTDKILMKAYDKGAEYVIVSDLDELKAAGIEAENVLPGAKTAVTVLIVGPDTEGVACAERTVPAFELGAEYCTDAICYDTARELDELGFRSVMTIERGGSKADDDEGPNITGKIIKMFPELTGRRVYANSVVTRKKIKPARPDFSALAAVKADAREYPSDRDRLPYRNKKALLDSSLEAFARKTGADLFGVSSAERLADIARQVKPAFEGKKRLIARDKSIPFTPWDPEISSRTVRIYTPADYLPGAKSVIVFGVRYHREVLRWAAKPPAEAVGPYAFETYVTYRIASIIGVRLVKKLQALGYKAVISDDLLGTASFTANPRSLQPDLFSNRFAAVAAGLGILTQGGHAASGEFGLNQRFTAVVTDAVLDESSLIDPDSVNNLCKTCDQSCITSCPVHAFTGEALSLSLNGCSYTMQLTDPVRCDWSKRYALVKESGFGYLGSPLDAFPEEEITPEDLSQALRGHDPVKKYRPVIAEPCVLACPYTRNGTFSD